MANAKAAAPVPTMSVVERAAFEASVAMDKESALVRGWNTGNEPEIQQAISAYNESERLRCKAAALHLLKL